MTHQVKRALLSVSDKDGIVEFVKQLGKNKEVLHPKPVVLSSSKDEVLIECVMQYNDSYTDQILCFANSIPNPDGGTHLTGFRTALTRVLNEYARKNKILKEQDPNLSGDDVREGQTLLIITAMKMETTVAAPCSGVVTARISTLSNSWARSMPRVSRPADPASRR